MAGRVGGLQLERLQSITVTQKLGDLFSSAKKLPLIKNNIVVRHSLAIITNIRSIVVYSISVFQPAFSQAR